MWCWRRLLRVPWTARRSNQSILKEISPEYSLEGLMLKLKVQYFGHLMQKANLLEKNLMLEKMEGKRRRGWQRLWWLDGITDSMDMKLSIVQEMVKDREAWHAAIHWVAKNQAWFSYWTTTKICVCVCVCVYIYIPTLFVVKMLFLSESPWHFNWKSIHHAYRGLNSYVQGKLIAWLYILFHW